MTRPENDDDGVTLGRRTLLGALGVASVGGSAVGGFAATGGAQVSENLFSIAQGDGCAAVAPLRGDVTVEELYDYRVPEQFGGDNGGSDPGEGPYFQSNGTTDLQQDDVTISFLYLGPDGLSLVVVHDAANGGGDGQGGSATWTIRNVPPGSEWAVMDDYYLDPETGEPADSNYDNWDVGGSTHTVDWTWGTAGTDGGALRSLGPALGLTIVPAFNDAAALWGDHYARDPIREWQFLSFPDGRNSPERISLALDEPVTVRAGPCAGTPGDGAGSDDADTDDDDGDEDGDSDSSDGEDDDGEDASGDDDTDGNGDEEDDLVTVELTVRVGRLNLQSRGVIPVGLGLGGELDPSTVDVGSLRFGPPDVVDDGGGARPAHGGHAGDGLRLHFPMADTGFELGDTAAALVGETDDGRRIEGRTGVDLVNPGRSGSADDTGRERRPDLNGILGDLL